MPHACTSWSRRILSYLQGKVCGQVVKVLVDSGASHNFVASHLVNHLSPPCEQDAGVSVVLGNGSRQDGSLLVP